MGSGSHDLILDFIHELPPGAIIEVGSTNGDSSTDFFAGLIHHNRKFQFYSIDIDPTVCMRASKFTRIPNFNLIEDFGEQAIPKIKEPIVYAYLDNYDFIPDSHKHESWAREMVNEYKDKFNLELNHQKSMEAHFLQTKLVVAQAAEKCVIHFDDTRLVDNQWYGKGGLAVPYLLDQGWHIIPYKYEPWEKREYIALRNWQ